MQTEYELWGVIFFKVVIFKFVFDICLSLLSAWLKMKASDGIREMFKDLKRMQDDGK